MIWHILGWIAGFVIGHGTDRVQADAGWPE